MKEYRATLTVNVFIFAEDDDEAQLKLEDMDISFNDPDNGDELQSDLIDWDITFMGEVDEEYEKELDEVDDYKTMKRCAD